MLGKSQPSSFEDRIKLQKDRIRRGDHRYLGMLSVISLDKEKNQTLPSDQARIIGRVIDLMDKRVPLHISLDDQDLLLPFGFPGELPDIVDPGESYIDGTNMIVCHPVIKLILVAMGGSPLAKLGFPFVICRADGMGRHMTFLCDPRKGQGFFVGGQFQFSTRLARAAEPVLAPA